jgi:hypothetical protein
VMRNYNFVTLTFTGSTATCVADNVTTPINSVVDLQTALVAWLGTTPIQDLIRPYVNKNS